MEEVSLDTTVPGGLYLSADGVTYHDAHGNLVEKTEAAKRLAGLKPSKEVAVEASAEEEGKVQEEPTRVAKKNKAEEK